MKKSLKFWKWKIEVKTKRLDADEKIGYLANELIKELKVSGRSIQCNENDKGFGNLDIWVYDLGKENAIMDLQRSPNGWSFKTKPTFEEF